MRRAHLAITLVLVMALASCGGGPTSSAGGVELRIVTTVSPITSIAENIGGTRVRITGIVPEGVNSHTFEPPPSLAKTLAEADLLIVNGLFLEEPALELARTSLRPGVPVLSLGDSAIARDEWLFDFSFPGSGGRPNPHLWPDPVLALRYAGLIRAEFAKLDPENTSYYAGNYAAFSQQIDRLDAAIRASVASIPEKDRALLTYHDSWAYFARRYGLQVIGAVQPTDFSEPSAREVASLIEQVKALGVPAVFGSEVFPSPVMGQIARETGAAFVDQLRDDDLPGEPGGPRHSYIGLMVQNMEVMVAALGGDTSALSNIQTGFVFEGSPLTVYPQ